MEADAGHIRSERFAGRAGEFDKRDFTYNPSAGYAGLDSFTYRASDGGLESPATTVKIHVGDPG